MNALLGQVTWVITALVCIVAGLQPLKVDLMKLLNLSCCQPAYNLIAGAAGVFSLVMYVLYAQNIPHETSLKELVWILTALFSLDIGLQGFNIHALKAVGLEATIPGLQLVSLLAGCWSLVVFVKMLG